MSPEIVAHTSSFRTRRFLNWFPLGVAYAMLYMGRYNLNVAKNALSFVTKEDFGIVFGVGTLVYGVAFIINGPLIDRMGGRKGMIISLAGAAAANLALGAYVSSMIAAPESSTLPLWLSLSLLYGANMYFQSFAAVSIVKVNAAWFHVRERGGFSGIFGTMISSGILLAYTGNEWLLGWAEKQWPGTATQPIVFFGPAALLIAILVVELLLLRDRPGEAGQQDFDTGEQSLADDGEQISTKEVFRRLFTNRIIVTIAVVEFCTGVLRQAVMQWFPIYVKEVWVLPRDHWLAPAGFGVVLFVAGVIGGNVAGWFSDLFFGSRRAPAAFGLYAILTVGSVICMFTLTRPTATVEWAKEDSGLMAGDKIIEIAGLRGPQHWDDVAEAVACVRPVCVKSTWDADKCQCSTWEGAPAAAVQETSAPILAKVERGGQIVDVQIKDPKPKQKAGDKRALEARPQLPMSPWVLGFLMFLMSLCVIGTHGLLSGTATMDFGGRKHTATVVGVIDGAVYLGTAVQAFSLGFLTSWNWASWPVFMIPFAVVGSIALTRIWHAAPKKGGGH